MPPKSRGRTFLPPVSKPSVLGRREVRVVHFIRFATMALAAELRHRVAGRAAWVVVATDEEHRLESALDVPDRAVPGGHAVLVVAGGAVHSGVDAVIRDGGYCEAIIELALRGFTACWGCELGTHNRAIPVVLSPAADGGFWTNRVIVVVVAFGIAVVAELRGRVATDSIRDGFDGNSLHHSIHG